MEPRVLPVKMGGIRIGYEVTIEGGDFGSEESFLELSELASESATALVGERIASGPCIVAL